MGLLIYLGKRRRMLSFRNSSFYFSLLNTVADSFQKLPSHPPPKHGRKKFGGKGRGTKILALLLIGSKVLTSDRLSPLLWWQSFVNYFSKLSLKFLEYRDFKVNWKWSLLIISACLLSYARQYKHILWSTFQSSFLSIHDFKLQLKWGKNPNFALWTKKGMLWLQ